MVSLMRNLTIPCPFCNVENKLTVFQADQASLFRVKCNACAREFQIDSTGNIADLKTSTPSPAGRGPPADRVTRRIIEPPEARLVREHRKKDRERQEMKGLLDELKEAEEEASVPGKEPGREPERRKRPTPEKAKEFEPEKEMKPAADKEKIRRQKNGKPPPAGVGKGPDDLGGRKGDGQPQPAPGQGHPSGHLYHPSGHPYQPSGDPYPRHPGAQGGPPGYPGQPQDMKPPQYPYPPGLGQYPPSFPFRYGTPPFSRNPEWVWKLLIISAVLGLFTSIVFFLFFNLTFNGGLEEMTIGGTVVDEQGKPISNTTLTILDENLTDITDERGRYEIGNISTGTHELRVHAEGYTILHYRFTLADWSEYDEDFTLENASGDSKTIEVDDSMGDEMYSIPTLMIVSSTIAFLGGITARRRRYWAFCVMASIAGIFSLGMIFVSPVLSIAAMVILFRTRYAYRRESR